jgi:hypothetical protein
MFSSLRHSAMESPTIDCDTGYDTIDIQIAFIPDQQDRSGHRGAKLVNSRATNESCLRKISRLRHGPPHSNDYGLFSSQDDLDWSLSLLIWLGPTRLLTGSHMHTHLEIVFAFRVSSLEDINRIFRQKGDRLNYRTSKKGMNFYWPPCANQSF